MPYIKPIRFSFTPLCPLMIFLILYENSKCMMMFMVRSQLSAKQYFEICAASPYWGQAFSFILYRHPEREVNVNIRQTVGIIGKMMASYGIMKKSDWAGAIGAIGGINEEQK